MSISIPVSWGELIDKITILEIKLVEIKDPGALENVQRELAQLSPICETSLTGSAELQQLKSELLAINRTLWKIEDDIRDCERRNDFGEEFIRLARSVYHTNDKRAAFKRRINLLMKSDLLEEKSYQDY